MAIAVLLNQCLNGNTIHYLNIFINKKKTLMHVIFIIPEEDMSSASDLKAQFYRGTLQRFLPIVARRKAYTLCYVL